MANIAPPMDHEADPFGDALGSLETSGPAAKAAVRDMAMLIDRHFDFVWRSLRRLGVQVGSIDDAVQQVFCTVSRRLDSIEPGREKSFLFAVAVRVASDVRRQAKRTEARETPLGNDADGLPHPGLSADELLDRKLARQWLDDFLDTLSLDVRTAFVLFEAEGMTVPEIARFVGCPIGTVASRLRLARKQFGLMVDRLRSAATGENE